MGQVRLKGIRKSDGDVHVIKGIDLLLGAKVGAGNHRVEAGQAVGPAPDAAWALASDANHQLAA